MSQKGTTKDQLFLIKLHEMALKQGGFSEEVESLVVGRAIGLNDRAINTIARDLAQANFIKKGEGQSIFLTEHGLKLVLQLLKEV